MKWCFRVGPQHTPSVTPNATHNATQDRLHPDQRGRFEPRGPRSNQLSWGNCVDLRAVIIVRRRAGGEATRPPSPGRRLYRALVLVAGYELHATGGQIDHWVCQYLRRIGPQRHRVKLVYATISVIINRPGTPAIHNEIAGTDVADLGIHIHQCPMHDVVRGSNVLQRCCGIAIAIRGKVAHLAVKTALDDWRARMGSGATRPNSDAHPATEGVRQSRRAIACAEERRGLCWSGGRIWVLRGKMWIRASLPGEGQRILRQSDMSD
jgi:hypothetical protein